MNHKRELVKEDRWSRVYQSDQSAYAYESKFANEETSLTALQLALEWASWDDSERLRFANAYREKPRVTADDERILEHLMLEGDRRVRATVASFLTCHSNKELVLELLLKELLGEPEFAPNFLNALAILGDYRAVPAVREFLERTLSQLEQSRDRTSRDLTMALICAYSTLWKLEGSTVYQDTLKSYLEHPDGVIRAFARECLQEWPLPQRR